MQLGTRKILDKAFSGLGVFSILLMTGALLAILAPIFMRGSTAFVFKGTVEYRRLTLERFQRGNVEEIEGQIARAAAARKPVYDLIAAFDAELDTMPRKDRTPFKKPFIEVKKVLKELLGPDPSGPTPVLIRQQYGETRWLGVEDKLHELLYKSEWDYSNPDAMGVKVFIPRVEDFEGTALEPLFTYVPDHIDQIMLPQWTFYWQFLTDTSMDAHFFGGIWPEVLGTLYLTLGAMIFAVPMGVIAAIYLCEYAREGITIRMIRTCISTLAGVPSIVFGLFGLAFFINTVHVSSSKSVLAGSLTLALLILPTIIRASEEAIRAVPHTYKEAALSLGSGRWHTVMTVILPAALPGILTGIVISMGRAAGETAPIIFTAAVSMGKPLTLLQTFSQPTPALPWNIYNLCTEHEAVEQIRHVQYGMVLTLVGLVLLLNVAAIVLRARIARKLRG
ncbi:MAG: phosphate ABC transporter permease PstA [Spartobacteria bacterium]|nr:phosphate ABC transporter permease PstA [Spartobacteria bacterium]